jgi:hypothetical protein
MSAPQYDIFRGSQDKGALWVEAVDGLGRANDRMKEHALQNPGPYFVFCYRTQAILASIDTSISLDVSERKSA